MNSASWDVMAELAKAGAVLTDSHFVYTSGKHGSSYINLDRILPDIALMGRACEQLAAPFVGEVEVVAAPAVGAIVLAVLTAQALSKGGLEVAAVWADKNSDGDLVVERAGFGRRLDGRAALVVEDLITTGGSVKKVCGEVRRHGAQVVGVSAVCNRGGVTAEGLGVPRIEALGAVGMAAFFPADCPMCADRVPIVEDVGHGAAFRQDHPEHPGGFIRIG